MFTEPTVFILGAGASWHYGYPTGDVLVEEVIAAAEHWSQVLQSHSFIIGKDYACINDNFGELINLGNNIDQLQKCRTNFVQKCWRLASILRQHSPLLIDSTLSQNPSLRDVGRLLIAHCLLEREKGQVGKHCSANRTRGVPFADRNELFKTECIKDNWYRFIINKMLEGIYVADDSFKILENDVKFITFNYDVSLDRELKKALSNVEVLQENHIEQFWEKNPIIHIYGSMGDDRIDDPKERETDKIYLLRYACISASKIQVMFGDKESNIEAMEAIEKASRVYFFGFGFYDFNMKHLGFPHVLINKNSPKNRRIYYTNLGDQKKINHSLNELLGCTEPLQGNVYNLRCQGHYLGNPNIRLQQIYYKSERNVYDALACDFDLG